MSTPGVQRQEIDQSNILQPAGTSVGGVVVRSIRGPINSPVLVTSDQDLVNTFGNPVYTSGASGNPDVPEYGYGMYAALQFLNESNNLYVARACDPSDKYAALYVNMSGYDFLSATTLSACTTSGIPSTPFILGGQFDTPDNISSIETSAAVPPGDFCIAALYPGLDGNNIAVSIQTATSASDWLYKYDDTTISAGAPLSAYTLATSALPIAAKVMRIDVYLKQQSQNWSTISANISGLQATSATTSATDLTSLLQPVETFYGTLGDQLDVNGNQLNITTVINGVSNWIYIKNNGAINTCPTSGLVDSVPNLRAFNLIPLSGGSLSTSGTGMGNDVTNAWNIFASRSKLPGVNILINADWNTQVKQQVGGIATKRMDCIATGQTGTNQSNHNTAQLIWQDEQYGYTNPSYMALYAGFDKVRDTFNSKWLWLPKAAFGAAIMARTDNVANTWDAPAGTTRGIISSYAQKFTLDKADIGYLYDRNINTSLVVPGVGSVMWGQKTAQLKATALDRINVRRLLIYLENSIEPMLQDFLFELNTSRTQQRISSLVSSFLGDVTAGGGLTGYKVVCDASNNTPDVVNNNQLMVDIYVQPTKVIEFITLKTIIEQSGVSIVELV